MLAANPIRDARSNAAQGRPERQPCIGKYPQSTHSELHNSNAPSSRRRQVEFGHGCAIARRFRPNQAPCRALIWIRQLLSSARPLARMTYSRSAGDGTYRLSPWLLGHLLHDPPFASFVLAGQGPLNAASPESCPDPSYPVQHANSIFSANSGRLEQPYIASLWGWHCAGLLPTLKRTRLRGQAFCRSQNRGLRQTACPKGRGRLLAGVRPSGHRGGRCHPPKRTQGCRPPGPSRQG